MEYGSITEFFKNFFQFHGMLGDDTTWKELVTPTVATHHRTYTLCRLAIVYIGSIPIITETSENLEIIKFQNGSYVVLSNPVPTFIVKKTIST